MKEAALVTDLWRFTHGQLDLDDFLLRHGYHGPDEGQLSSRSRREDPAPLLRLVERFRGLDPKAAVGLKAKARRRKQQHDAWREVVTGLQPAARFPARVLLTVARRWTPLAEVGKAMLLQTLDATRAAARAVGRDLVKHGVLDCADDVFYLTVEEIEQGVLRNARQLVATRRARRDKYLGLELPDTFVGVPEPYRPAGEASPKDRLAGTVTGLGVSQGVAEGPVRLVLGPESFHELLPGDIDVCRTTDPGWVPVFLVAAGLVVDVGGVLSHGAIVAREMSLPCVVNTKDGTCRLRDGDRVGIDGAAGVVASIRTAHGGSGGR